MSVNDHAPRSDTYKTIATEPVDRQVKYPDGSVNLEIDRIGTEIDFRDTTMTHFSLLVPGNYIGIDTTDYDGNKSFLAVIDSTAVRLAQKTDGSGTEYTLWELSSEQYEALLGAPFTIGARSSRLDGEKVTKISSWIGEGYNDTPDTDKANPLVVAARIASQQHDAQ